MRFAALLFDLDGTLVDSHHEICLALDLALRDVGLFLPFAQVERLVDGSPLEVIWSKLTSTAPSAAGFAHFASSYRTHYVRDLGHATVLFPDVAEGLERLRSGRTLPLAVVSNKSAPTVLPLLQALGIAHYFDVALGSGGTPIPPKPGPALLLQAASKLHCAPDLCAMIGDTTLDVLAGQRARMTTIAVCYGMAPRDALVRAGADYVVDGFRAAEALLS